MEEELPFQQGMKQKYEELAPLSGPGLCVSVCGRGRGTAAQNGRPSCGDIRSRNQLQTVVC
jgi:hypothetical protein